MATFTVWRKNPRILRTAWVCGAEPALVRQVLDAYRAAVPQGTSLFAQETPERDIWDQVLSCPPPGGRRLFVHGAGQLKNTRLVGELVAAPGMDTAFTVFIDAADDFPRADGQLAPHLAVLQAARTAQLIRCCRPSRDEELAALVASWWPGAGRGLAQDVLARCGGSLTRAAQACDKAVRAGLDPTRAMAALACDSGDAEVAGPLIAGDKRAAIAAARLCSGGETGGLLALLASRLAALEAIRAADAGGAGRDGRDRFLHHLLGRYAGAYDPARVRRDRETLAALEAAWRGGADEGVPEALVALW
jgi:hypothetical protein